jgi:hypothetical protein
VAAAFNKKNISIKSRCFLGALKKKYEGVYQNKNVYHKHVFSEKNFL